jgi:hypothetical protein
MICIYYNVIISWSVVLFFSGFFNPLPWSIQYTKETAEGVPRANKVCDGNFSADVKGEKIFISEEFFYKDILHVYNDDCTKYDTSTTMG